MKTLLLDRTTWDLVLDASGNIAAADEPYRLAQDVASAVKLFVGELWYDTGKGVPYFDNILGKRPPAPFIAAQIEQAAATVPGVVSATVTLNALNGRQLTGQITLTDTAGNTLNVGL